MLLSLFPTQSWIINAPLRNIELLSRDVGRWRRNKISQAENHFKRIRWMCDRGVKFRV